MKEINEGQIWKLKNHIDSWGGINIVKKINDDEFLVHVYTEPLTRNVVLFQTEILEKFELCE